MNSRLLLLLLFSSSFIRNWEEKSFLFFIFQKFLNGSSSFIIKWMAKHAAFLFFLFNSAPIQNPSEHIASHA
jgi:hypothetical protein